MSGENVSVFHKYLRAYNKTEGGGGCVFLRIRRTSSFADLEDYRRTVVSDMGNKITLLDFVCPAAR